MQTFPNRHRNHEIETLSERFLKNCIPSNWVVNSFQIDYGLDYNCEITSNNKVIGCNFTIQLKGKEADINSDTVTIRLKRSTINRWLNRLEPTMIVCYLINENEGYWTWFQNDTVDLTLNNKTFTISISKTNKLSSINWTDISDYVELIFSKRHLLYGTPKLDEQNEIGWQSFFENKYEKVCSIFYDLISKKPNDPLILQALALSEYHLFNYQKALININKALQIEDNEVFYLNKASILVEQGFLNNEDSKIVEAIEIFEKAIQNGHNFYALYYNYGNALIKLKDYEKAILYLKKALVLDPNKSEPWNNLGNCYMNIGEHKLEMICYDNALLINPDSPETLFSKGSSLFKNFGDTDVGLKYMLQGAEKTERHLIDNPSVFFWIAEAYLSKCDFENSIKWNTKGLTFFSSDNFLMIQKARIDKKKNNS